jgi:hypothetical protein
MIKGKIYCICGHESGVHENSFDWDTGYCRLCSMMKHGNLDMGECKKFEESFESIVYTARMENAIFIDDKEDEVNQ